VRSIKRIVPSDAQASRLAWLLSGHTFSIKDDQEISNDASSPGWKYLSPTWRVIKERGWISRLNDNDGSHAYAISDTGESALELWLSERRFRRLPK
jgi:hypothetical protein